MNPIIRHNHNRNLLVEVSRTEKSVRVISTTDAGTRDIRNQLLQFSELVGFGNNKRLETKHFDKEWKIADVDFTRLAVKWLISHNNNYHPLTTRARKEIIMLLVIAAGLDKIKGAFSDSHEAHVMDSVAETGDYVAKEEKDLVAFTGAELTSVYIAAGGTEDEAKALIKKSKAHIAAAIWEKAQSITDATIAPPAKPQKEKTATTEKGVKKVEKSKRDIVREFLVKDKIFKMVDIASLIDTTNANASTTIQLLKTRPGEGFSSLVLEKLEDGSFKVTEPSAKKVQEGA